MDLKIKIEAKKPRPDWVVETFGNTKVKSGLKAGLRLNSLNLTGR
jgi:hypothetical protein